MLYANNKWAEEEIKETTPFTIATNDIKYLGVTLTEQVKDVDNFLMCSNFNPPRIVQTTPTFPMYTLDLNPKSGKVLSHLLYYSLYK